MITKQHSFICVFVPVLLGVWLDVSSGQSIQLIPQYPLIQGSVTMSITGITGKLQAIFWFKGTTDGTNQILIYVFGPEPTTVKGPLFRDGMSVSPDGFLIISSLTKADEGNYIVKIQTDKANDIRVYLQIYEKVSKPTITASVSNPKENDKVTLTCTSTNAERIVWSRVPSGATLSSDNKTITFSSIKRSDAGDYSCTAANPASEDISDPFKITVAYGPENMNIKVKKMSPSAVSLECSADSVPPSTYKWRLNGTDKNDDKNPLEIDQKKDEGNYTCVATNSVTKITATSSTYVNASLEFPGLDDDVTSGISGGVIAGIVIGVLVGVILITITAGFFFLQRKKPSTEVVYENTNVIPAHIYETAMPTIETEKSTSTAESQYEQLAFQNKSLYYTLMPGQKK